MIVTASEGQDGELVIHAFDDGDPRIPLYVEFVRAHRNLYHANLERSAAAHAAGAARQHHIDCDVTLAAADDRWQTARTAWHERAEP